MKFLAGGKRLLDHRAAHLDEDPAVSFQALHDEAFAAEQAGHDLLLEVNADGDPARGAKEGVLLADQPSVHVVELDRHDRAWNRSGEGHAGLASALVREDGGEQALAGHESLACTEQLAHEAAALLGGAVAEHRGHGDGSVLPDHCARFGHGALARVQFDFHELQFLTLDLEIDIVGDRGITAVAPGVVGHGYSGGRETFSCHYVGLAKVLVKPRRSDSLHASTNTVSTKIARTEKTARARCSWRGCS